MLEFEVNNQIIKRVDNTELVNLSENYLGLSFTFKTNDWNDLAKFVLFTGQGTDTFKIAVVNNTVSVPNEVLTGDYFIFSLYGVSNDVRITTNQIKAYLISSGYTDNVTSDINTDIDLNVVEEIYLAISSHKHTLTDITDLDTVEMEVVYDDESEETFNVVVK